MKTIAIDIDDKEEINKKKNEINILKAIDHSNLIKCYDYFIHKEKKICIVMEYADAGDLYHKIQKYKEENKTFKEREIWDIFLQICQGLYYLHYKYKIMHRDIKCQNIFLMKDNTVKIGDFGTSKKLVNFNDFAKTSTGTPYFLSPEICNGQLYNFKTDIWMLGCTLYEMCTLEKPFNGDNLPALMYNIIKTTQKDIPSEYSDIMRNLVNKLLNKTMDERPFLDDVIKYIKNNKVTKLFKINNPFIDNYNEIKENTNSASCGTDSTSNEISMLRKTTLSNNVDQVLVYPSEMININKDKNNNGQCQQFNTKTFEKKEPKKNVIINSNESELLPSPSSSNNKFNSGHKNNIYKKAKTPNFDNISNIYNFHMNNVYHASKTKVEYVFEDETEQNK